MTLVEILVPISNWTPDKQALKYSIVVFIFQTEDVPGIIVVDRDDNGVLLLEFGLGLLRVVGIIVVTVRVAAFLSTRGGCLHRLGLLWSAWSGGAIGSKLAFDLLKMLAVEVIQ